MELVLKPSISGRLTVTEHGGGMSDFGFSWIICGENGERLRPIVIIKGLPNGDHATFEVFVGMTMIQTSYYHEEENTNIWQVTDIISCDDGYFIVSLELIGRLENGAGDVPVKFNDAILAAHKESHHFYCREPHYIKKF